jgi:hypothetical protein
MSHIAPSEIRAIALMITMLASMVGAFIAIFVGIWSARRAKARKRA